MNKRLLNRIYETIFENEPAFLDSCRRTDAEIRKVVENYDGALHKQEAELFSEEFIPIISAARHDGFETGVKFAFRLMAEMLMD